MSGKSSKNKAPKAKVPEDDNVPVEEFDEEVVKETEVIEIAPTSDNKEKKGGSDSKKKSKKGFKLPSIEPIILTSFTIFIVACLIVTGVTTYGIIVGETSDQTAEYGDRVQVNYVGSYYGYYGQTGAEIFDTSWESIANDDNYAKSWGFQKKEEYTPLDVTIGAEGSIKGFSDAIIGHKIGDRFRVEVQDGYGSLVLNENYFTGVVKAGQSIKKIQTDVSTTDYTTFFKDIEGSDVPSAGNTIYNIDSPYGWKANVTGNSNGTVTIEYLPVNGETYTSYGVKLNVTSVTDTITFTYDNGDNFDTNAKMLKAAFNGKIVYIIQSDDTNMSYKTTDERTGTKMYFEVELVGFAS